MNDDDKGPARLREIPLSQNRKLGQTVMTKKVKQLPGRQTSRSAHRPPPTLFARVERCLPGVGAAAESAQTSFFVVPVSVERSAHPQPQVSPRMIEQGFHGGRRRDAGS